MAKKYMFHVQKLERQLAAALGQEVADRILEGCEGLTAASPRPERARLMNLAMARLGKACDRETAVGIRERCACKPPAFLAEAKRIHAASSGLDDFLRQLSEYGKVGVYYREGDAYYCSYRPKDCVCGMVKDRKEPVDPLWCECCKGHAKWILEGCLGAKVEMELLGSIVAGGAECKFRITRIV